jgi:hypothetical protein
VGCAGCVRGKSRLDKESMGSKEYNVDISVDINDSLYWAGSRIVLSVNSVDRSRIGEMGCVQGVLVEN